MSFLSASIALPVIIFFFVLYTFVFIISFSRKLIHGLLLKNSFFKFPSVFHSFSHTEVGQMCLQTFLDLKEARFFGGIRTRDLGRRACWLADLGEQVAEGKAHGLDSDTHYANDNLKNQKQKMSSLDDHTHNIFITDNYKANTTILITLVAHILVKWMENWEKPLLLSKLK